MAWVDFITVAAAGYLLGAIPFAVIIARFCGVDIFKVGSGNPGATNVKRSCGKAAVGPRVPWHGCAGMVPRAGQDALPRFLRRHFAAQLLVQVAALHVVDLVDGCKIHIGKAQLLPLIDEGRPLLEQVHGGKTFGALRPEFLASVAGNDSGMVVVFDVKGVPAPAAKLFLP